MSQQRTGRLVIEAIRIVLIAVAFVGINAWWVVGIVTYWQHFALPWQLAGFFLIPNLVLPWALDANVDAIANTGWWWLWGLGPPLLFSIAGGLKEE